LQNPVCLFVIRCWMVSEFGIELSTELTGILQDEIKTMGVKFDDVIA